MLITSEILVILELNNALTVKELTESLYRPQNYTAIHM